MQMDIYGHVFFPLGNLNLQPNDIGNGNMLTIKEKRAGFSAHTTEVNILLLQASDEQF